MSKHQKITINAHEWDKTFQLISWWKAEDVKKAKVMVVGAGALGNEVLKNLALLNVGHILIIDFDRIEYSNLSRSVLYREKDAEEKRLKSEVAAERIREINSNVKVMTMHGDIMIDVGLGVFRRMDVVVGCLDNRIARLFINRHCFKTGKIWIDGAIENLAGELSVYKPGTSCYECQLNDTEWSNIRYRLGCPTVAMRNANAGRIPTTPISASIIGAMQAQEALKIVMGNIDKSMAGNKFIYEGMNNIIMQYKAANYSEEGECDSHFFYENVIESPLKASTTIEDALDWIGQYLKCDNPIIELDYDVILEISTDKSNVQTELFMPKPHFTDDILKKYEQIPGEDIIFTKKIVDLSKQITHKDKTLKDAGIPPLQILKIRANDDIHFVELTGDEDILKFI